MKEIGSNVGKNTCSTEQVSAKNLTAKNLAVKNVAEHKLGVVVPDVLNTQPSVAQRFADASNETMSKAVKFNEIHTQVVKYGSEPSVIIHFTGLDKRQITVQTKNELTLQPDALTSMVNAQITSRKRKKEDINTALVLVSAIYQELNGMVEQTDDRKLQDYYKKVRSNAFYLMNKLNKEKSK